MSNESEGTVASGALGTERRQRYRTSPLEPLWVTVLDRQGREVATHVLDVSVGGIRLFFGHVAAPDYRVRESVKACMRSSHLDEPLMVDAEVCRVAQCEWGRVYGFEFVNQLDLTSLLPEVSRLFNQRRHCRAALDSDRPVEFSIKGLPLTTWDQVFGGITGVLRDISSNGLSFYVGVEVGEIEPFASMEFSFSVPGSTEPLTLWVKSRHWDTGPEGAWCGVVFDKERNLQFSEKREKLLVDLLEKLAVFSEKREKLLVVL